MGKYEIKIKFIDGEELYLDNVTDYGIDGGGKNYYAIKNEYKMFLNANEVKYIGRVFDIENVKAGEVNG